MCHVFVCRSLVKECTKDTQARLLMQCSLSNLLMTQSLSLGMLDHVAWSLGKFNLSFFYSAIKLSDASVHLPTRGGCITLRSMCVSGLSKEAGRWIR